jgi:hypothetical protein
LFQTVLVKHHPLSPVFLNLALKVIENKTSAGIGFVSEEHQSHFCSPDASPFATRFFDELLKIFVFKSVY